MNRTHFQLPRNDRGIVCVIAALAATTLTFLVFSAVVSIGAPDQVRLAAAVKARQVAATTTVVAVSDAAPSAR